MPYPNPTVYQLALKVYEHHLTHTVGYKSVQILEKGTYTALPFLNNRPVITPYKVKIRPTHPN